MINWDLLSLAIFYVFILLIYYKYKHKFEVQGKVFIMYKSKLGLGLMDRIAKRWPRLLNLFAYLSVFTGFLGMGFILYFLIKETFKFVSVPGTSPPLSPVLPGIDIPGAPALSFWHWIIALFVVAVVHEFSHGVYARLYDIKVKSSGFAFLGPILAAFVEPDEKVMSQKPKFQQLAILSAGPFSNLVWGLIFMVLLFFAINPLVNYSFEPQGIIVNEFVEGYPMSKSGITLPFVVKGINGIATDTAEDFAKVASNLKPKETVTVFTDKGEYSIVLASNPDEPEKGFMGVTGFKQKFDVRKNISSLGKLPFALLWINLLFVWLFIINIGVGLFNLLPLGPIDGGKMFFVGATALLKDENKAKKLFVAVTYFVMLLIFINILPWLIKLVTFIGKTFLLLVSLV